MQGSQAGVSSHSAAFPWGAYSLSSSPVEQSYGGVFGSIEQDELFPFPIAPRRYAVQIKTATILSEAEPNAKKIKTELVAAINQIDDHSGTSYDHIIPFGIRLFQVRADPVECDELERILLLETSVSFDGNAMFIDYHGRGGIRFAKWYHVGGNLKGTVELLANRKHFDEYRLRRRRYIRRVNPSSG